MPFYDLKCICGEEFNIRASIKEREEGTIKCIKCGDNRLSTVYSTVNIIHSPRKNSEICPNYSKCGGCCKV